MRFKAVVAAVALVVGPAALGTSSTAPPATAAEDVAALLEGCVPCHGEDGIARDSEVPHLAGQNEIYLANQMRAFRSGERVHPEMAVMMHDVDDDTIAALAAYFSSLPPRP